MIRNLIQTFRGAVFATTVFFERSGRAALGVAFCAAALCLAAFYGGLDRKVKSADMLGGKWVGTVVWNDASGRPYQETMRTALFFLPGGVIGTVITFPTGAIGGTGTYVLQNDRLTVHCTGLSVNSRPVPLSTFDQASWFHKKAVYTISDNGNNLTLTPEAGPTPAPCWPLLVSPKPIVLSRIEQADEIMSAPAPRE